MANWPGTAPTVYRDKWCSKLVKHILVYLEIGSPGDREDAPGYNGRRTYTLRPWQWRATTLSLIHISEPTRPEPI
eukprot:4688447-Pyramimonas_sp.AAC.1